MALGIQYTSSVATLVLRIHKSVPRRGCAVSATAVRATKLQGTFHPSVGSHPKLGAGSWA